MLHRFRRVSGNIYRSSAPTPEDIIWLNKQIGITRIISLDKESSKKIDLSCRLLDIDHIDLSIDMTKSSLIRFIKNIGKLLKSDKKTLIHCAHGRDRTGMAIAMYRCQEQGWDSDKAIEEAKSLDFGKGLGAKVVNLYISLIKDSESKNDVNDLSDGTTIVDESKESYDDYQDSPSSNLAWSPYADRNVKEDPYVPMSLNDGDRNPLGGFGPSIVGNGTVL